MKYGVINSSTGDSLVEESAVEGEDALCLGFDGDTHLKDLDKTDAAKKVIREVKKSEKVKIRVSEATLGNGINTLILNINGSSLNLE